jgi:hypothetical protein
MACRDTEGAPHPPRDYGKWLHPRGFAEGSFGLWQAIATKALCRGVLAGGARGVAGVAGGARWKSRCMDWPPGMEKAAHWRPSVEDRIGGFFFFAPYYQDTKSS